jgi:acylglycerol lipase
MKILILGFVILFSGCITRKNSQNKESFSFKELFTMIKEHRGKPELFGQYDYTASDNVRLAVYSYIKNKKLPSVLILHGGGAHATAGYQFLAEKLFARHKLNVFMVDLRGHGKSGGRRGDSPTVERMYRDIEEIIHHIKKISGEPVYVIAHSSAAGLILNYISWGKNRSDWKDGASGYIFISPEFGYKSKTAREGRVAFARVRIWVFVIAGLTMGKIGGNWDAVFFNYPPEVLAKDPLLLDRITRNMSVAQTPDDPIRQFAAIDRPFAILMGSDDELMDPGKVLSYAKYPQPDIRERSVTRVLEGAGHLSAIWRSADEVDTILGKWMREKVW